MRRQRERDPRVTKPARARRRTVPAPEARQGDVHPVVVVVHARGRGVIERQDDLRRESLHLVHQEPGVSPSHVPRLQAELGGDLPGAKQREDVCDLEGDRFVPGHHVAESGPRLDPVRPAERGLRLRRRLGVAQPARVRERLPHDGRDPHLRGGVLTRSAAPRRVEGDDLARLRDDEVTRDGPLPEGEDGAVPAEDPGIRHRLNEREARLAELRKSLGIHLDLRGRPTLRADAGDRVDVPGRLRNGRRGGGHPAAADRRRVVVRRRLLLFSGEPAQCHVRIDQARIDRPSGKVEDDGIRRDGDGSRGADGRDDAVADDDRPLLDRLSRGRDDLRVHEREDARRLGGKGRGGSEGHGEGDGGAPRRQTNRSRHEVTSRVRPSR